MSPPVRPSCGLPDIHPSLNRRRPERVARQYLGPPLVAARGFAEYEPVPWRIAAVDEAVPYRIRPLDQMLEILEAIFDPGDLGQRQRHVDADLQEAVAHRHLDPHVGRKPADPHHVGDMAMDVEPCGPARLDHRPLPRPNRQSPVWG